MQSRRLFSFAPLVLPSLFLAVCLTSTAACAGPARGPTHKKLLAPSSGASGNDARPAAGLRLDSAEALLKALSRRSVELQERSSAHQKKGISFAHSHPGGSSTINLTEANSREAMAKMTAYRQLLETPSTPPRPVLASRLSAPASQRMRRSPGMATDLNSYVALLSRTTPGGAITGRFSDWRSPSIYRMLAGHHNGYDISLPAGSAIVVGWPGRVTAVTNWYGHEYGITVTSPDGFSTTYGHLAPSVRTGVWLEPGDVVGLVVHDHVDIKMRGARGNFVDFARGAPMSRGLAPEKASPAATTSPQPDVEPVHENSLGGPDWTLKPEAVKAALAYVRLRRQEVTLVAAGGPRAGLLQVQSQLADSRSRLLVNGVPEGILLAAFLDTPQLQTGSFAAADARDAKAGVDLLGDWLHRQQLTREAREASGDLRELVRALNG